jgi:hypothetical protein
MWCYCRAHLDLRAWLDYAIGHRTVLLLSATDMYIAVYIYVTYHNASKHRVYHSEGASSLCWALLLLAERRKC